MKIYVTKQSGEKVLFSKDSLKKSLLNSGASIDDADLILEEIDKILYNDIPTKKLYDQAFKMLKEIKSSVAARYSLKRALQKLGPEGYYFEKWVAKIFEVQGYNTITGQILQGKSSVNHEIDVVVSDKTTDIICECKFRNDIDAKISVTTPMYFLSRFNDLSSQHFEFFKRNFKPTKGFLITNAFFTLDSITFSEFYGVNLISWNYPETSSIKLLTDKMGLYPITCLTTLTDDEENILLDKNCVLVRDLVNNPVLLDHFKFSDERKRIILNEANELLSLSK